MKILIMLLITIVVAFLCFGFGSLIGKLIGKSKKKQDDIHRNGSAHD